MTYRASVPPVWVRSEKGGGNVVEQTFTEPFTIGRAASCEVRFDVKSVSRLHARVVFEKGRWCVHDAGSTNGLYVGGQKMQQVDVNEPITLRLGPSGPILHLNVAYPRPEATPRRLEEPRQEPVAPPFFGPEIPAEAPFRPPPLAKAPPTPTPPVEATLPEPPVREVLSAGAVVDVVPKEPAQEFPKRYCAHRFTFSMGDNWNDETVYILGGPVADGLQHNITIHVEPEVQVDALLDYAEVQIQALQAELNGCRLLQKDQVQFNNGLPAYRAIFTWNPAENQRLYQEQLYVLHQQMGYILTATFTKKTRKTLGAHVERIMLSFTPEE